MGKRQGEPWFGRFGERNWPNLGLAGWEFGEKTGPKRGSEFSSELGERKGSNPGLEFGERNGPNHSLAVSMLD